ncbi:MAG: NAD(P)-binding protein [Gemmatimonadales bacterium]
MVTRDVGRCRVGQVLYTPWCDGHGKVVDDGTISRLGESVYRLTAAEPNYRWLHLNAFGLDVAIEDVSDRLGALALQGPLSRDILNQAAEQSLDGLKYFRVMKNRIAGTDVEISRTGYTGDLGFEIWVPAGGAIAVWDALIRAGTDYGITPAGIWALDLARIEAGLVMLDVDYHSSHRAVIEAQKSSPFELSLDWTVSLDKGPFNGKAALAAEKARGPSWRFVGIEVDWDSLEALYARGGSPARPADHRLAPERAGVPGREADRLCHERLLVAAAQEVPGPGPPRGRPRRAGDPGRVRGDRRAPAAPGVRLGSPAAVLRPAPKEGLMNANRYDAIVVGGGHNGLVAAAYLARAGKRTIVLERRHLIGGAAVSEEVFPGSRSRCSRTS